MFEHPHLFFGNMRYETFTAMALPLGHDIEMMAKKSLLRVGSRDLQAVRKGC